MTFRREDRYVVLKIKDLHEYLPQPLIDHLRGISDEVRTGRQMAGKAPLECVVVEHDWPEYEPTWQAIEARMDAVPNAEITGRTLAQKETHE